MRGYSPRAGLIAVNRFITAKNKALKASPEVNRDDFRKSQSSLSLVLVVSRYSMQHSDKTLEKSSCIIKKCQRSFLRNKRITKIDPNPTLPKNHV